MGTGTTVGAAELERARGIGIELDPAYVAIARERLVEAADVHSPVLTSV
jgi:site-specific DNA-methyltransferase (adenine-specific)